MRSNALKRVIGRVSKSLSMERAGIRDLPNPQLLQDTFGVVRLQKGTNFFHSPFYFPPKDDISLAKKTPKYGPTETHSPFFFTEDTANSWMYQLEQDLVLLKLYQDCPPPDFSKFSRSCLKREAYTTIFGKEPQLPLSKWRGDTSSERDSLVEAIFLMSAHYDGFISTGDNEYDERVEVCIHNTQVLSHVPRKSDSEVTTMVAVPLKTMVKESRQGVGASVIRSKMVVDVLKLMPGIIMISFRDALYNPLDGTWALPSAEMQEHFTEYYMTQLPSAALIGLKEEEIAGTLQSYFDDLSKLDKITQQKKIAELMKRDYENL